MTGLMMADAEDLPTSASSSFGVTASAGGSSNTTSPQHPPVGSQQQQQQAPGYHSSHSGGGHQHHHQQRQNGKPYGPGSNGGHRPRKGQGATHVPVFTLPSATEGEGAAAAPASRGGGGDGGYNNHRNRRGPRDHRSNFGTDGRHHSDRPARQNQPFKVSPTLLPSSIESPNNTMTGSGSRDGARSSARDITDDVDELALLVNRAIGVADLPSERPQTPPSNISCFSVSSSEAGVPNDGDFLRAGGCEFIPAELSGSSNGPLAPVLATVLPGDAPPVELFIGQLPFNFCPQALCDGLRQMLRAEELVVTRVKTGPKPTCAFISVKQPYAEPLLAFTKKVLCDRKGMWVARPGCDETIAAASRKRLADRLPGVPHRPMVVESVMQCSRVNQHHQPVGGPRGQTRSNGGGGAMAPPPYAAPFPFAQPQQFQYGNNNNYPAPNNHHQQLPRSNDGQFPAQYFSAMAAAVQAQPWTPPQQPQANTRMSVVVGDATQGQGRKKTPSPAAESVCECGAPHTVVFAPADGSCAMCARSLPERSMVRGCTACESGALICSQCVKAATAHSNATSGKKAAAGGSSSDHNRSSSSVASSSSEM